LLCTLERIATFAKAILLSVAVMIRIALGNIHHIIVVSIGLFGDILD
jgi:disulfide bond formation protein DsbB